MDGVAWPGHPDQKKSPVASFPAPNQLRGRPEERRSASKNCARCQAAVEAHGWREQRCSDSHPSIRYRNAVFERPAAASPFWTAYMEDLAPPRIVSTG